MAWRWALLRANTGFRASAFQRLFPPHRAQHQSLDRYSRRIGRVEVRGARRPVRGPSEKVAAHLAVQRFLKRFVAGSIFPPVF